jgi:hypothetical protein
LFGKKRTLARQPKSWKTIAEIPQDSIEIIVQHLLFLDVISKAEHITCLAVGKRLSADKQKKMTEYIHANRANSNVIFLTNVPANEENKKGKKAPKEQGLLALFHHITQENKKDVEIIAYANAGDFGGNKKRNMKYACMLA